MSTTGELIEHLDAKLREYSAGDADCLMMMFDCEAFEDEQEYMLQLLNYIWFHENFFADEEANQFYDSAMFPEAISA